MEPKTSTLDLNENEESENKKKKVQFEEGTPEKEESYTKDELLAWMGKRPGKGSKGSGTKGSKGGFQGNCFHWRLGAPS